MKIKQGNTYMINARIKDIDMSDVVKMVIKFNEEDTLQLQNN